MIDLKELRDAPERFIDAAKAKNVDVDIARLCEVDEQRRQLMAEQESRRAEQKRISKEIGPEIGKRRGMLKKAEGDERTRLEKEIAELEAKPAALKNEIQGYDEKIKAIEPEWRALWLRVPQPAAEDVPRGASSDDNIELSRWHPEDFDPSKSFTEQRGFAPKTHIELIDSLGLVDFERGVKMAGSRHYVLVGDGMRLHQAILRFAFDFMTQENGFTPMSVPVIVREECMVGTGFFPGGREQAYHVEESNRGAGHDLFLTGTGEVGLMGYYADEILERDQLPITCTTVSTCFRREAGAAGKDTAGLYRVHQFDKVEQVVIHEADDATHREWHRKMIGYVETMLQRLGLPYRLLQCCTGDLGSKNEDMIDVECWIPGRGEDGPDGRPLGDWGETHSASRLNDYQTRRLNLRYRDENRKTVFPYALNNTVCASPRILVPLLELWQQEDGSILIPEPLRPYMGGQERIG